MKVLIVESDRLLAQDLSAILKKAGHQTDWKVDPQAAIEAVDKDRPDAVILDIVLAGRSGVEFLYELRSYPEWQDLPVVIWSALPREQAANLQPAFQQLNIAAYHHKASSSFSQLLASLPAALSA